MEYTACNLSVTHMVFCRSFDTITEFCTSVIYHSINMSFQITIIIMLNVHNNVKVSRLEQHVPNAHH